MLGVYYLNMDNVLSASTDSRKKLLVKYIDSICGMYLSKIWLLKLLTWDDISAWLNFLTLTYSNDSINLPGLMIESLEYDIWSLISFIPKS